jgi:hypothetical protein
MPQNNYPMVFAWPVSNNLSKSKVSSNQTEFHALACGSDYSVISACKPFLNDG